MVAVKSALIFLAACLLLSTFAGVHAEAAHGRKLKQDTSDCDDCACAEVECASGCGSANKVESFTCDEVSVNSIQYLFLFFEHSTTQS
jgi:hypothetical protein